MNKVIPEGEIRVGVLGAGRGKSFAVTAADAGFKLAAICDNFQHRLDEVSAELGVKGYADFDEFIQQDFDAVVIAAPFHLHGTFAIKALEAGKHVLSETSTNITLREGARIYELVEKTGLCYMLAENYCYTRFNQEMKRLYEAGEIGEVRYAEGQYNHPIEMHDHLPIAPGIRHWRHQEPPTYYNTHALAPLMYITNTLPVAVSGQIIPQPTKTYYKPGYVILVRMNNGAIFRLYGNVAGHDCGYSLHGTHGAMETVRGHGYFGPEQVRVWHEPWDLKDGQQEEREYFPNWVECADKANATGHGGSDFFTEYKFAEAIRTGVQPYLDAYHGIMMSNVGILAWRSALQGGVFLPVPDLKDEKARAEMLKDRKCPYVGVEDTELMPENERCVREFTPEITEAARAAWKKIGYTDAEIEELLK